MAGLGYPNGVSISEPRPPLTAEVIAALKAAGMTGADIARAYGITRQAVSKVARRDGTPTPRQVARALAWPWNVPVRFQRQEVCRYLSQHLAYVAGTMLPASNLPAGRLPASNLPDGNLPVSRLPVSRLPAGNIGQPAPTGQPNPTQPDNPTGQTEPTREPEPGLSWTQLTKLKAFYLRMSDFVIIFDASIPPSRGVSAGGFAYVQRLPEDEDLLIRATGLSDDARNLWRIPELLPNPVARTRTR